VIRLFDLNPEKTPEQWFASAEEWPGHRGPVACLAFSPDGRWLASGSDDRTVRLQDVSTGDVIGSRELDTQVKALAFSPDGRTLYTGNGNTNCYQLLLDQILDRQKDQG
jgi:WD40 repeat protein